MSVRALFPELARLVAGDLLGDTAGALLGGVRGHFTAHSRALLQALDQAAERTAQVCDLAFAGKWSDRLFAGSDAKALAEPLRRLLDARGAAFQRQCHEEWRRARAEGPLAAPPMDAAALAGATRHLAGPQGLVRAAGALMAEQAERLRADGYPTLAEALTLPLAEGEGPFFSAIYGYHARQVLAADPELAAQLQLDGLQRLGDVPDILRAGFRHVLARLQSLENGLRPLHSFSLHNEVERRLVRQLRDLFRALPAERQARLPGLLQDLGRAEFAAGEPAAALAAFREAAHATPETATRARLHHEAHLAALEAGDLPAALEAIRQAAELDAAAYAPFPFRKYRPEAILGAGGFGVAYRCRHTGFDQPVVVKALHPDQLGRGVADLFKEARVLKALHHGGIIRVEDCDYADDHGHRPYLVLEWFANSRSLEQYLAEKGPLDTARTRALAVSLARALAAAHAKGVLHRDLKPANLLVREEGSGFGLKVIDFGLALRPGNAVGQSLLARSRAGTLSFAPPEQRGELTHPLGPCSDLYAYGKTLLCCLLGRTEVQRADWRRLERDDAALAEVLERCVAWRPEERFQSAVQVLSALEAPAGKPTPPFARPDQAELPPGLRTAAAEAARHGYRVNADGTVLDTKTGLMWKRCAEGQSGLDCAGEAARYTWDEAMARFKGGVSFAGYDDWRLPTREELRTLVWCSNGTPREEAWDHSCGGKNGRNGDYQRPTIVTAAFPNTPRGWFWSASANASDSGNAWYVHFNNGNDIWNYRSFAKHVRLVRAGQ